MIDATANRNRIVMQKEFLSLLEKGVPAVEESVAIHILALYEDDYSRRRGMDAEKWMARRLGVSLRLRCSWFKLRFLSHPKMLGLATEELRKAGIVLFSIPQGGALTLGVRAWIETELAPEAKPQCGLLALLESGSGTSGKSSVSRAFLEAVARNGNLEFLSSKPAPVTWTSDPDFQEIFLE